MCPKSGLWVLLFKAECDGGIFPLSLNKLKEKSGLNNLSLILLKCVLLKDLVWIW